MIKQDDIIQLHIDRLGSNAEGVARYDDYAVFVPLALTGESVVAKVNYAKKNIAYADVVAVANVSPQRQLPPCKYYGVCGGCQLQHINYDAQLQFKHDLVANCFAKIGGMNVAVSDTIGSSDIWHYRNKLSLPVGGTVGNCNIGMYQRNSHNIVDLDSCMLSGSWADSVIAISRQFFNSQQLQPYNEKHNSGQIRHVVARYHNEQLLVTIVVNGQFDIKWDILYDSFAKQFDKVGLFVNINTSHNNVILGKTTIHLYGIDSINGISNGVRYCIQPDSFFQVNDKVKDDMYARVRQLIANNNIDVLIDCFSGVGLLTGELYSDNYDTIAIEIDASSVADANAMKEANGLIRLTNICGDANQCLPMILTDIRRAPTANISLVVDPPRKGLGSTICDSILQCQPTSIVYVSCDPATLARDVKHLSSGYDVASVQPYDMFPNTRHVETLVCLTKKP